ncbi:MAG: O-antigen ligase family protein [Phycisphaerales bacterium]|jgi:hypothetical protein|nr:O-antigen ligase family protein [Phycisphaerales bacterium]
MRGIELQKFWLRALVVLLGGYLALDKGFAYLGAGPVYVGEIVLGLGVMAVLVGGGIKLIKDQAVVWIWGLLAVDGLICTLPYLKQYGILSLRDATLWGYGLYALMTAICLLHCGWVVKAVKLYGRLLPAVLMWLPAGYLLQRVLGEAIPNIPGTNERLIQLKPGDTAVHLAGAAAFMALGLHQVLRPKMGGFQRLMRDWWWWIIWSVGVVMAASANRGGMLSIFAAAGVVMALRPRSAGHWGKAAALVLMGICVAIFIDLKIEMNRREVSAQQLISNVTSIFEKSNRGDLDDTKQWRLNWWNEIIDYTFGGKYFWTGKGYGVNLALDDGFLGGEKGAPLRSPHSAHMTILARSGVPGLVLWALLQLTFAAGMLHGNWRARKAGQEWWARVDAWVLAYWIAFNVNASFDVYLEGPQAGIWFWSWIGFGMAVLAAQKWDLKHQKIERRKEVEVARREMEMVGS